jgi:hypothetical protein
MQHKATLIKTIIIRVKLSLIFNLKKTVAIFCEHTLKCVYIYRIWQSKKPKQMKLRYFLVIK